MKWFVALVAAGVFAASHLGYIDLGFKTDPGVAAFEQFFLSSARYDWDAADALLVPGGPGSFSLQDKRRMAVMAGSMGMTGPDVRNIDLEITGEVPNQRGDRIDYEGVVVAVIDPQGSVSAFGRQVVHDVRFTAVSRAGTWQIYSYSDTVRSKR